MNTNSSIRDAQSPQFANASITAASKFLLETSPYLGIDPSSQSYVIQQFFQTGGDGMIPLAALTDDLNEFRKRVSPKNENPQPDQQTVVAKIAVELEQLDALVNSNTTNLKTEKVASFLFFPEKLSTDGLTGEIKQSSIPTKSGLEAYYKQCSSQETLPSEDQELNSLKKTLLKKISGLYKNALTTPEESIKPIEKGIEKFSFEEKEEIFELLNKAAQALEKWKPAHLNHPMLLRHHKLKLWLNLVGDCTAEAEKKSDTTKSIKDKINSFIARIEG